MKHRAFPYIQVCVAAMVLIVFIYMALTRFNLGVTRYFDADELAYLHWSYRVFTGSLPYRDFLLYVPPGFLYVLAPVFFLSGVTPMIASRIAAWGIFLAVTFMLGVIYMAFHPKAARMPGVFFFPGIILGMLPIPSDKFLEVRPDTLAMLFALCGIWFQIRVQDGARIRFAPFASGFAYGLSLVILPKTLPQVLVAGVILAAFLRSSRWKQAARVLFLWAAGVILPFAVLFAGIQGVGGYGSLMQMTYSLVTLPFEVNRIGEMFGMRPDLFFYPNTVYYGEDGWNVSLIANHILWFVGLTVGAARLVTPFIRRGREGVWTELLIAGSLVSHIAAFMYGYPLRHAQYLIPVAALLTLYVADAVYACTVFLGRYHRVAGLVFVCVFLTGLVWVNDRVVQSKLLLTNSADLHTLQQVMRIIPRGAYVLDLIGATLYYKDPYYVCCVPFGQWEPYLTRPLPDLVEALERTQTAYIYQGKLGRVDSLAPAARRYIHATFEPYNGDPALLIRKP